MKQIILSITILLAFAFSTSAKDDFSKEMKKTLKELREYKNDVDYNKLAYKFERISEHNPDRFEPMYYAAYCYILKSWSISDPSEKEEVLNQAFKNIKKAKEITADNDELLVMEAFYYQAMILVNPVKYGQKYAGKAAKILMEAQKINPENPRAEFLQAQNIYYSPEQCGGGKDKALPLFEKAAMLFKKQDTSDILSPKWGENTNNNMIKQCKN